MWSQMHLYMVGKVEEYASKAFRGIIQITMPKVRQIKQTRYKGSANDCGQNYDKTNMKTKVYYY